MLPRTVLSLALAASVACTAADRDAADQPAAASRSVDLNGAGATFPYPIYSKWFSDYASQSGVRINYGSVGSGAGIKQLSEGTVDFGATDSPMTDEEMTGSRGGKVLHFPTVLGAAVITYNLPEVTAPLRLNGSLVADIFLGRITEWDDPRILAENPGVQLPDSKILVVHRSDGSGTSYIFTDYLTAVSHSWAAGPGRGKSVAWPVGIGGRGNEGVAGQVKQTPGSVGYVELAYARQNRLPAAALRNAAGNYVEPTIESISAAAAGAMSSVDVGSDYRVSIVNATGDSVYPIASFTWLLVYEIQSDSVKGRKLADFMRWMYADGQRSAASLDYAPLPEALAQQLSQRVSVIEGGPVP